MLGGRFKASKIEDGASALPQKMSQLTGLFHTKLADIPSLSEVKRVLKPTTPPEENPPLPDSSSENSDKEIES
ncbi:MAG: hypothetical protein Q8L98_08375 [Chlamydiales bacterium]|nr:hypothetical protein [Chlamydiales bacterium]